MHAHRRVVALLRDKDMTHKLFVEIAPRYEDRPGGYTRILKLGPRPGTTPRWRASSSSEVTRRRRGAGGSTSPTGGTGFHGFAAQPGAETVAGALAAGPRDACCALTRRPRSSAPGGPTRACTRSARWSTSISPTPLFADDAATRRRGCARSLNRQLAPRDRRARRAARARGLRRAALGDLAHATATSSTRRRPRSPLLAGLAWQVAGPLDVRAMAQAAYAVLGEHDFRAFCRRPSGTSADEPIAAARPRGAGGASWTTTSSSAGAGRLRAPRGHRRVVLPPDGPRRSSLRSWSRSGAGERTAADLVERPPHAGTAPGCPRPRPPEGLCLVAVGYD